MISLYMCGNKPLDQSRSCDIVFSVLLYSVLIWIRVDPRMEFVWIRIDPCSQLLRIRVDSLKLSSGSEQIPIDALLGGSE